MKAIYDAWLIQIEVTNACIHNCAHCTRGVRHLKKPYFVDLEFVEKALYSLKDWKHGIGCMGGEPTIHPKFAEICELYRKHIPQKKRRGLWTSGGKKYEQYKDMISDTFGIINFNDHYYPSYHQPLMVSSEEIIKNEKLRNKLIDNCWLQRTWSPTITFKGAFFCEVASTFDLLFDGPGGYPLEPGWWKKGVKDFKDQRDRYCRYCSIPIPMETYKDSIPHDYVSKDNAERLRKAGSPMAVKDQLKIIDNEYTLADLKKSKKYRPPQEYADKGTEHFWIRNQILLSQKVRSVIPWIKSKINTLLIR